MSGTVTSNTLRSSGVIAATAAGLNWVCQALLKKAIK
jgi:hypothetical protein